MVQLSLSNVPSDVTCVQILVSDGLRSIYRHLDVTPGSSVATTQTGLPIGTVSIGVDAYAESCASVTSASVSTWVGGVVHVTLAPSTPLSLAVNMSRPGSATIGINFPGAAVCGDAILGAGESCDDGNTVSGDGCSATCAIEPGFTCPAPGMVCQHSSLCGDAILGAGESCDDGNTVNGDGCSATCAIEPGFTCPAPGTVCQRTSLCGDRILTAPEQCDDGNTVNGDGCSATCALEPGFSCPAPGTPCQRLPVCGDGLVETGEQCDLGAANGHTTGGPGCSATCQLEYKLFQEAEAGAISAPLQKVTDATASGGQYVQVTPGNNSTAAAPTSGFANFSFSVGSAGTYRVFGKITAPTTSDDSFWVRMDGGAWVQWNDIFTRIGTATWKWDEVHDTVGGNALVRYSLTPGSHTLTIAYREDGAKLDQILITNDLTLAP